MSYLCPKVLAVNFGLFRGTFANTERGMYPPFVIGIYHCCSKPNSSNEFLENFIDEMLELQIFFYQFQW